MLLGLLFIDRVMPVVGGVTAAPVDTELGSLCEVTKLGHPQNWGFGID